MNLKYIVKSNDNYINVKEVLKAYFKISDRLLLRLKNTKNILLNGSPTYVSKEVKVNDEITVIIDFVENSSNIVPTKMDLDILYEDDCYLVINKSPNLPVHPSMSHYENSLSNGVKYYFDSIGLKKKIRPVNRLDKDTSGIVIFAKNEYIQECLVSQMKSKVFEKQYIAVCNGTFTEKSGTINLPIARKQGSIIERCVDSTGDIAITHYEVIHEFDNISVVKCLLETGRTHQIRVHLSNIGHPILGDTLYGEKNTNISRQLLHAYKVKFVHPLTNEIVTYTAPIPDDIDEFRDASKNIKHNN
ncbi:MAG: RluA family pseudouridine synthase [Clostridia bacterium]|nr:RluA family pseudouridine synthase [Clostridia bacterium]